MIRTKGRLGLVYCLLGVGLALNGLVAGPHAFAAGWQAVAVFLASGVALVVCGAWLMSSRAAA